MYNSKPLNTDLPSSRQLLRSTIIAFIVAAVLTPPDPMSQLGLAIPTIILYEVAIYAARLIEKSRRLRISEESADGSA